jgi:serine/threonine protein kinase/Tol biopolymer transport system component
MLRPGVRLGPYEIQGPLGVGGMGEIYRARDAQLDRDVAIKILPEAVVDDQDRLARFEREARLLAALDHPYIAQVYGFEKSDRTRAIVMELVEGPTLEERIAQGPIAIPDALHIARQLAEALETAHELGIIHRDLKPANIKLKAPRTPSSRSDDGRAERVHSAAEIAECTVKILDFGLAKAMDLAAGAGASPENSPTLTARATELGIILGTAAYMAPEQARGRPVDRRADVWAFGVVLYETLTGLRLFRAEDASDTMAAVLRQPIELSALPAGVPHDIRVLLGRCLERDPRQRLRDIGEARIALERTLASPNAGETAESAAANVDASRRGRATVPWLLFGIAMIALVVILAPWSRSSPPPESIPVTRVVSPIGMPGSLVVDAGPAVVLSPDGRAIVLRVRQDNTTKLYMRHLDEIEPRELVGSEEATNPFFSPDGSQLGFFAAGGLRVMPLAGGATRALADAATGRGAAWAENGDILFQSSLLSQTPLVRVTAAGGQTDRATTLDTGEATHRWPQILPGGRLLYSGNASVAAWDDGTVRVQTQQGVPGKVVLRGGYHGRYVPSGHLLYVHAGTLYGVRFDLDRLETTSQPAPIVERIVATSSTGGAQYAVASNGTLAYVPGNATINDGRIHWLTADGKSSVLTTTPGAWSSPRFSPDGKLIALQIAYGSHDQIALYDWESDRLTRITPDGSNNRFPIWTPDGRHIVFSSDADGGAMNIFRVRADGSNRERLTTSPHGQSVTSMHPNGRFILYSTETGATRKAEVWVLPLEGNQNGEGRAGTARPLLDRSEFQVRGAFSPDGRLVAYMGTEQDGFEIFVKPFDGDGGPWRVSAKGGAHPTWSKTGNQLLYTVNDQIMSVPYTYDGRSFNPERPRPWSAVRYATAGPVRKYDIHPDGTRAVVASPDTTGAMVYDRIVFVFNFFDELRRRLPADR